MLEILRNLLGGDNAAHKVVAFPKMRNVVLDFMEEGRRKSTIHMTFELDASLILSRLDQIRAQTNRKISLTAYIAKAMAQAVKKHPHIQAYRKGAHRLVIFEDVDVTVMTQRNVNGVKQPVPLIVRAADKQGIVEINEFLAEGQKAPLFQDTGQMSRLEAQFFELPRFLRRIVWFLIRRDPHLFRKVAGTVGLTAIPSKQPMRAVGTPISPMSLMLLVGILSPQPVVKDGVVTQTQVIQMNLSADHDVTDGMQLTRFCWTLRDELYEGKFVL
ncbi:MAG: 2-oxo acid dehydrogenase subunit E2 [Burkholderiales bacterium]